jgi:hypothetical protein
MFSDEESIGALLLVFAIGWIYRCIELCGLPGKASAVKSAE